jgi:hypothetical protein
MEFVAAMDTETYILGDGDLCKLAGDALERRGKPVEWAPMLAK